MRSICCYCGILYDLKEPIEDDHETHGICGECLPGLISNLKAAPPPAFEELAEELYAGI